MAAPIFPVVPASWLCLPLTAEASPRTSLTLAASKTESSSYAALDATFLASLI